MLLRQILILLIFIIPHIIIAQADTLTDDDFNVIFVDYAEININTKSDLEYRSLEPIKADDVTDSLETPIPPRPENFLEIGGAVRFNLIYTYYEGQSFPLGTASRNEVTWDTWRLNVNGRNNDILFSFEYRFYPTFNTHFIHHGWLGYQFSDKLQLEIGVNQVPFGILPFASHSWWFSLPYYAGLEDDYDIGVKFMRSTPRWDIRLAYYPLAEPRGTSDPNYGPYSSARYSYDVIPIPGTSNQERNQFNARIQRNLGKTDLGISLQTQEIYNQTTQNVGRQLAFAAHAEFNWSRFNIITEYIYSDYYNIENDLGETQQIVKMGAYGFGAYEVATNANIWSAGVSYTIPGVNFGPITDLTFYNDYSIMFKNGSFPTANRRFQYQESQQNVVGALISAGNIYTYIDLAAGSNHPWLTNNFGGTDLGPGNAVDPDENIGENNPIDQNPYWNYRFNINMGYYF